MPLFPESDWRRKRFVDSGDRPSIRPGLPMRSAGSLLGGARPGVSPAACRGRACRVIRGRSARRFRDPAAHGRGRRRRERLRRSVIGRALTIRETDTVAIAQPHAKCGDHSQERENEKNRVNHLCGGGCAARSSCPAGRNGPADRNGGSDSGERFWLPGSGFRAGYWDQWRSWGAQLPIPWLLPP